ncbi:chemotaxis protein [Alteromonas gracilis]|uniref:chemotaxis protein n=1 Tax=Alteromonas gracilis TaxID=1479524 RepID=UPI003219DFEB
MKFDSIKSRLVLMTLICVMGMALLVVSQHYFTQRLIGLNQQRDVLLRMGQDLLQMRRHEKDFLLRHDRRYFEKFVAQSETFTERLNTLVPTFNEYQLPIKDVESLSISIDAYARKFQQVVSLQERIGLSGEKGVKGQIAELEGVLLSRLKSTNSNVLLSQLKLAVRNFQLTQESQYARQLDALSLSLLNANDSNTGLLVTLNQYRNALQSLVDGYMAFGLTHNEGLRGSLGKVHIMLSHNSRLSIPRYSPLLNNKKRKCVYTV